MWIPARTLLLALTCCATGCAEPARIAGPVVPPEVTVHGVIQLTEPGPSGPQGQPPPPFLHADDGRSLGLLLSAELTILADADSDGRGVTVTGTLEPISVEPIGPVWDGIVVSSYRFDSP